MNKATTIVLVILTVAILIISLAGFVLAKIVLDQQQEIEAIVQVLEKIK